MYGALWLAFVVGRDTDRRWARVAGGILLVLGLPLALTTGFRFWDGPVAVFALLAGLAVALWSPRRATQTTLSASPPPRLRRKWPPPPLRGGACGGHRRSSAG